VYVMQKLKSYNACFIVDVLCVASLLQAASKIGDVMEAQGTRFVKGVVPKSIEKLGDGTLKASTD
jgi:hypothetical protein